MLTSFFFSRFHHPCQYFLQWELRLWKYVCPFVLSSNKKKKNYSKRHIREVLQPHGHPQGAHGEVRVRRVERNPTGRLQGIRRRSLLWVLLLLFYFSIYRARYYTPAVSQLGKRPGCENGLTFRPDAPSELSPSAPTASRLYPPFFFFLAELAFPYWDGREKWFQTVNYDTRIEKYSYNKNIWTNKKYNFESVTKSKIC